MIPVKINGVARNFPSSWYEVSVSKFLRLTHADKMSKVIAILGEINIDDILYSSELNIDEKVGPFIKWYFNQPEWEKINKPDELRVKDKVIDIPSDLGYSTFEQVENLKIIYHKEMEKQLERGEEELNFHNIIIPSVATWLQPAYDEAPYDEKRTKLFESYIEDMSIMHIYPLAAFFLRKYIGLQPLKKKHSPQGIRMTIITTLRKLILQSLKNLAALEQSLIYQEIRKTSTRSAKWNIISFLRTGHTQSGRQNLKND